MQKILILFVFCLLLLTGCLSTNQFVKDSDTTESVIINILSSNQDLAEVMNESTQNIIPVTPELWNDKDLQPYYKDLFVNKTFTDSLFVVELNTEKFSYLTLIDVESEELLEIFYIINTGI